MTQPGLFDSPKVSPAQARVPFRLRPYQVAALEAIRDEFAAGTRRTLLVLPTGCGKTEVFAQVIGMYPGERALVMVHRQELAAQAAKRIRERTGRTVHIERGNIWALGAGRDDVVVAMVQSLNAGSGDERRMHRWASEHFGPVVIDEAHHATAKSYRAVLEHFDHDRSRVLGVTATPDRADEEALGQIFQTVAYEYELLDAINAGWLCMPRQKFVDVDELDLSQVKTTAGDLNQGQLAELVERDKMVLSFSGPIYELAKGRKSLVFCVTVKQAMLMSQLLNNWHPACAEWVSGETPDHEREQIFGRFGRGDTQFLVNVGVATEGWDDPSKENPVQVVAICRPTKSRALYAQMIGRGTRPVPGLVDPIDSAEERLAAIAGSVKPYLEVLDFVGNAGKHTLACVTDLLAGNLEPADAERLRRRVAKKGRGEPVDVQAEMEGMKREDERVAEARKARGIQAKPWYSLREIDPFESLGVQRIREKGYHRGRQISDAMRGVLERRNIDPDKLNYTQAIEVVRAIKQKDLPTCKQCRLLEQKGLMKPDMTATQASRLIDVLQRECNWDARRKSAGEWEQIRKGDDGQGVPY